MLSIMDLKIQVSPSILLHIQIYSVYSFYLCAAYIAYYYRQILIIQAAQYCTRP